MLFRSLGKQFPTFCPMGPVMVTTDELPDPNDVSLTTTLNGKVMQSAHTSDFVFNVARLIEYYSQFYLLRPGDVITTGSPSGVGFGRNPKIFMRPGDTISVEVKGVGTASATGSSKQDAETSAARAFMQAHG